jgi:hypothetical protein
MTGFKVLSTIDEIELKKLPVSSQTLSVGSLIEQTAGTTTWAACTATTNFFTKKAICYQAVTSTATTVLAYQVRGNEVVEGACTASSAAAAGVGDRLTLTDLDTLAYTGSDVTGQAVSFVMYGVGSDTSHVIGKILVGNGVDPDAT